MGNPSLCPLPRRPCTTSPPVFAACSTTASLDLPLPGRGRTAERLDRLAALGHDDLVLARLAEAHTDALAILADLGPGRPGPDPAGRTTRTSPSTARRPARPLWGVWAADPPGQPLRAVRRRRRLAPERAQAVVQRRARGATAPW